MKKILFLSLMMFSFLIYGCSNKQDYSEIIKKTNTSKIITIKEVESIKDYDENYKVIIFDVEEIKTLRGSGNNNFKIGYKIKNDGKSDSELQTKYQNELKDKVYIVNYNATDIKDDYLVLNDNMIELLDYNIKKEFDKQSKKLMNIINQFINV